MADPARAEALVQAMERDEAFQVEVQQAPTVAAKRAVLDARGFGDVGLAEMKAYVESKGGKLVAQPSGHELSDEELAAVAGGTFTPIESLPPEQQASIGAGLASAASATA